MPASREISVLYVEDDPVLRSLFADLIDGREGIKVVGTAADADEAIDFARSTKVDAALLDLALGPRSINGAELGLRLRQQAPDMGIVLISQHLMPKFLTTLPETERHGWAYVQKRGDLSPTELAHVIRATVEGKTILFTSLDNCRFRTPVRPGDVLRMPVEVVRHRGDVFKFAGKAFVGEKLAAEVEFTAMVVNTGA